jgi:hypothetical protein
MKRFRSSTGEHTCPLGDSFASRELVGYSPLDYGQPVDPVYHVDFDEGRVIVSDLAGATSSELSAVLQTPPSGPNGRSPKLHFTWNVTWHENKATYVVAPLHSQSQLPLYCSLRRSFFPHLDLDHLEELLETGLNGFGLGLFQCGQLGGEKIT